MYDLEREKSLVQAAQAGDRNAFGRLYDTCMPGLYGYVRVRMPSTVEAEDLVSDVVLMVVQRLDDFHWRYPGAFRAWIFQIARRKAADHYRRNPTSNEALDENETLRDSSPLPETQALHREMRVSLLGLIQRLSPRKQEVILLRYFGGFAEQGNCCCARSG